MEWSYSLVLYCLLGLVHYLLNIFKRHDLGGENFSHTHTPHTHTTAHHMYLVQLIEGLITLFQSFHHLHLNLGELNGIHHLLQVL